MIKKSPSSLNLFKVLFIILLSLSLSSQEKLSLKDSLGESFEFKTPPKKIVSLSPAMTEILYFIGAGDKIVGVTRYCNYPKEAEKKDKIGGIIDVDIEKILRIKPDIVFATRGNPLEVIEKLKSLGIRVFAVDTGDKLEDILNAMKKISVVIGNFDTAKGKILELEKRVEKIKMKTYRIKIKRKIFLKLGSNGLWTCGKKTYINDLILKAGGENIADFREGWFEINIETLISKNPDIIIVLSRNEKDFLEIKNFLCSLPGITVVQAVKNNLIFSLNLDIVERPGPRIVDALEEMFMLINAKGDSIPNMSYTIK